MRYRFLAAATLLGSAVVLRAEQKFYQITLIPSGTIIATDLPVTKGQQVVFHGYPSGTLMSMPRSSVKSVSQVPAASAQASNLAEQVIPIGNLAMQGGSSQGGPQNLSRVGQAKAAAAGAPKDNQYGGNGFYNNMVVGESVAAPNSANDYQVGRTYAYAPSNATQSSPGAPPTNPAMTNGQNPPQ
jgi:hypothetical protein